MVEFNTVQKILLWAIPLLFAITVHETAHGWVAYRLGDPTAKMLGRLTLNPVRHIDLFGTIILPALTIMTGGFIFGWAKPVPITWRNLKHVRRDMALVAFAGPFANIMMAFLWGALALLGNYLDAHGIMFGFALNAMGLIGIQVNVILGILNLLPFPPLDGSKILMSILPGRWSYYLIPLERYGLWILLLLLVTGVLGMIISPAAMTLITLIRGIFQI